MIDPGQSGVAASTQYVQNSSFDPDFGVLVFEALGYDGVNVQRQPAMALAMKLTEAGSITYLARSAPGTAEATAKWQVIKMDETTGLVITYADSNANFDNVATDLPSLTYG